MFSVQASLRLFLCLSIFASVTVSSNEVYFPSDKEWVKSSPNKLGIDDSKVEQIINLSFQDKATMSVVIIKDGRIIGEKHAKGFNQDSVGTSWSVAKSFYAALIGISINKGEISSLDDPVSKYLDYFNDERSNITIRDLLDMSSGLSYPRHQHEKMFFSKDHLEYSKSIPKTQEPGKKFEYNNVNSMLIGDILKQATGTNAEVLLKERILDKIDSNSYKLWTDEAGNALTYCCIDMSARDFSRFGLLFANNGKWKNEQIIPKEFIDETFQIVWDTPNWWTNHERYYSLHWWVSKHDEESKIFNASGKFGQYIFVDRENNVVVTRITKYDSKDHGSVQKWGPLKYFTWANLNTAIFFGRSLLKLGIIEEGDDVVTPATYEDGESKEFYRDYSEVIKAISELSK